MTRARALLLLALAAAAAADAGAGPLFDLTDEEYYEMPQLFRLDEFEGCLARGGVYCVGSFELEPASLPHPLFTRMQRYSLDWVNNFNHTRLHRGLCLPRSCAASAHHQHQPDAAGLQHWFSSCVNASTMTEFGLWARPLRIDYCQRGEEAEGEAATGGAESGGLSGSERGFAALVAALMALSALSTGLDLTLADQAKKKGACWALAFSLRGCWRALQAPAGGGGQGAGGTDLRALDGLRVICMMCVIVEHVCWLITQAYIENTRTYENMRSATDVMLMVNSTLVVQIFFLMSSFLLAHKILEQRRRGDSIPTVSTFFSTMKNRIIRVSPSYWIVVWFAASWWRRMGRGPLWAPLVGREADICAHKWWTHLLYLNNVIYPDDKCLIQTWYLAADMQLYAISLILTLTLLPWRRAAPAILTTLTAGAIGLLFVLAYIWSLVPTYVMHNPELVREIYAGESSFNVLYQSPLSNSPGALAGLLLAHVHHALLDANVNLNQYKTFRWISVISPAIAIWWAAMSPLLLGRGPPQRVMAAALAAIERPVFSLFVALGLLGAMHDVQSPLRTFFSWRGWATPARLSFGVLLLHMPYNKSYIASKLVASNLTRQIAILEWFGVALVSYGLALPLALLVEFPSQRLQRAIGGPRRPACPQPAPVSTREKEDAD